MCETKKYDFINGFLEKRKEISLFVKHLNQVCPEVFEGILLESLFDSDQIKQYAVYTLYYSTDYDIKKVNDGEVLSRFISEYQDFLKIEYPYLDKSISGFKLIDVCFEWINYDVSNKELFEAVYARIYIS